MNLNLPMIDMAALLEVRALLSLVGLAAIALMIEVFFGEKSRLVNGLVCILGVLMTLWRSLNINFGFEVFQGVRNCLDSEGIGGFRLTGLGLHFRFPDD